MTVPSNEPVVTPVKQPDLAGVPLPPPLIYGLGWLVGWLVQRRWPLTWTPGRTSQIAGIALTAAGALLVAGALLALRAVDTSPDPWKATRALATRGPYGYSRNPIYLGLAALYAGVALFTRSGWALLLFPVVLVGVQQLVIVREEAYLARKFGQPYQDYLRRARRWF